MTKTHGRITLTRQCFVDSSIQWGGDGNPSNTTLGIITIFAHSPQPIQDMVKSMNLSTGVIELVEPSCKEDDILSIILLRGDVLGAGAYES